jgi:hypothetical protein
VLLIDGAFSQLGAHGPRDLAMTFCARIRHFDNRFADRTTLFVFVPIVEAWPIDVIGKCSRSSVLGEDQRMVVQFDMVVVNVCGTFVSRTIQTPLASCAGLDEHPFHKQGMIRREQKSRSYMVAEFTGLDPDREHSQQVHKPS